MKVFISQAMRNIPDDEVLKIREEGKKKFLEIYKGNEEVEFISSFENDLPEDARFIYWRLEKCKRMQNGTSCL